MEETTGTAPETEIDAESTAGARAGLGRRILRWTLGVLGALVLAVLALFVFLHTDAGRKFVADRIEALEFQNGMKIGIGELNGSLFGSLSVEQLTLSDPNGQFLSVPEARLDWRPLAYLWGHVDIRSLEAESAALRRLPQFRPVESTGPLLPDLDIDVGKFRIGRLTVDPAVSGETRVLALAGKAHIADGRAVADFTAETLAAGGLAAVGGDRMVARIDAVPEANRLGLDVMISAPRGGVIAAMAGVDQPLDASLKGAGDWTRWDGKLAAQLGDNPLADVALSARDGLFAAKGEIRAGRLVNDSIAGLLGPVSSVDLTAGFEQRRAEVKGTIVSETLSLAADGLVDLGANGFDDFKLDVRIPRPAVLARNLSAQGLRGSFVLNGAFARPDVGYAISAARIGINDIVLERLTANGQARYSDDGFLVPVDLRVGRIAGLDSLAGGPLDNVRLSGNLAVKGSRILSDDLRLLASRIDARLTVIADVSKGFYAGAIDGELRGYKVESVGIFDINTDLDLEADTSGGYALEGRVRARSTRVTNEALANFFGGPTVIASNVRYGTDGILRLSNVTLNAPLVRITGGSGSYAPNGRIVLDLDAQTERYGPVALAVSGTISQPRAILKAESPGFGIGLADLTAEITGIGSRFQFNVTAQTDYGPLTADVSLLAQGPVAIEVRSANLGGIGFTGSLNQTAQGPFAGQLRASGRGLEGIVRLAAMGEFQKADFNLRAQNTTLDGAAGFRAGTAIVDGSVVLYDQPEVVFDAQFADVVYNGYSFSAGRAQVDYRAGSGHAKLVLEGSRAFPFRVAANARLEPELWSAAITGRVRGISFATKGPARIVPGEDGYELLPTDLSVGSGSMRLAGEYGERLKLQSRVENIDLALANNFAPTLGIGGKASGSIDFEQAGSAFPIADARLKIDNFTRTTASAVSEAVDINLAGKLLADGGESSVVFRRGGSVIGRLQASLRPLPPGAGGWVERLLGAPLSGGIRYNGPASTLSSLSGMADQRFSGGIGLAADFSGRVRNPQLTGVIKANDLVYENLTYGTRLTQLVVDGRFTGDRVEFTRLTGRAGAGTVSASGTVSLAAARGFPMDLAIDLDNAQLARGGDLAVATTGELRLTKNAGEAALLAGDMILPETRYRLVREGAAQVPKLKGVRFKPETGRVRITGEERAVQGPGLLEGLRLNIKLTAPERFYVSGMGLESEWSANLTVSGTATAPTMRGTLSIIRGTLGFAGRSFSIEDGEVRFDGGSPIDPRITLRAQEDVDGVTVVLNVTGQSSNPQIAFSSTPGLPQEEIVSRILFGRSAANLSSLQALQLAASLNTLRGGSGGFNPLDTLRAATGIDRLRVLGEDDATGRGTAIAAGKYITDDIYIEVITDARGFTATQLEISLTRALSILSQAGGSGATNVSVQYEKNY